MQILDSSSGSEKTIHRSATSRESLPVRRLFFPTPPRRGEVKAKDRKEVEVKAKVEGEVKANVKVKAKAKVELRNEPKTT